jgi:probable rRNA maturation factor
LQVLCTSNAPELTEPDKRRLQRLGDTALALHEVAGDVQLILAEDEYVRTLNAAYRAKDAPTDVLSFAYGENPTTEFAMPDGHDGAGGEIYISLDRAGQQAIERGVSAIRETGRLLVHGLLHLAGYDHQTREELEHMESETDRILEVAGLDLPHGRHVSPSWQTG